MVKGIKDYRCFLVCASILRSCLLEHNKGGRRLSELGAIGRKTGLKETEEDFE